MTENEKTPAPETHTDGTSEIFEAMWKNHRDELLARVAQLEGELASRTPSPEKMQFEPIVYALHYGGRCRDCADANGVCPTSGMPCDTKEAAKAAQHCLKAWQYGIQHGFIDNPFAPAPQPRAAAPAPVDK